MKTHKLTSFFQVWTKCWKHSVDLVDKYISIYPQSGSVQGNGDDEGVPKLYLQQGFPNFLWPCTPSTLR